MTLPRQRRVAVSARPRSSRRRCATSPPGREARRRCKPSERRPASRRRYAILLSWQASRRCQLQTARRHSAAFVTPIAPACHWLHHLPVPVRDSRMSNPLGYLSNPCSTKPSYQEQRRQTRKFVPSPLAAQACRSRSQSRRRPAVRSSIVSGATLLACQRW